MSTDFEKYLELQKEILVAERRRLGFIRDSEVQVGMQLSKKMSAHLNF